jgi:ABC-type transport system involved in multi-copper enzyme maturation permease subunit
MNFLPIAERELRVAARKRATFWIRMSAALLTLVIAAGMLLIFSNVGGPMPNKGQVLFLILAWMAFAYAFAAGVFLTADSLSEEKREGTLGLLFLTDLRGYDVVLGKLAATSLHAVYGVVAGFPVLAISLMLGGLLASEFWTGLLAILNMLFVSLAVGMLASTFTREALPAMNITVAFLSALVGLPYLLDAALAYWNGTKFAIQSSVAATLHPFLIVTAGVRGSYWVSLLLSHTAGWLCLALAAWRVRRHWQEQPVKIKAAKTQCVVRSTHEADRRSDEPIVWLASRSRRFRLWILLPVFVGVALISLLVDAGPVAMAITTGIANVVGLLLFLWMTAHATRFFVDGVRNGAFELILCTPMPPSEIVRGQWIAYMRTFAVPLIFLIAAEQILASMQWVGSGVAMHAYAIASQVNSAVTSITTAGAIGWFGMWMGLRSRKQHMAVIKTFVFVFILPAVAIGIVQMILMITFAGFAGTGRQALGPTITCILWVMKDAAFILWARRNLYWHFREGVAGINVSRPVFQPLEAIRPGAACADQT